LKFNDFYYLPTKPSPSSSFSYPDNPVQSESGDSYFEAIVCNIPFNLFISSYNLSNVSAFEFNVFIISIRYDF